MVSHFGTGNRTRDLLQFLFCYSPHIDCCAQDPVGKEVPHRRCVMSSSRILSLLPVEQLSWAAIAAIVFVGLPVLLVVGNVIRQKVCPFFTLISILFADGIQRIGPTERPFAAPRGVPSDPMVRLRCDVRYGPVQVSLRLPRAGMSSVRALYVATLTVSLSVRGPLYVRLVGKENDGCARTQGKQLDLGRTIEPGLRRRSLYCEYTCPDSFAHRSMPISAASYHSRVR